GVAAVAEERVSASEGAAGLLEVSPIEGNEPQGLEGGSLERRQARFPAEVDGFPADRVRVRPTRESRKVTGSGRAVNEHGRQQARVPRELVPRAQELFAGAPGRTPPPLR